jgi:hypothetical protein
MGGSNCEPGTAATAFAVALLAVAVRLRHALSDSLWQDEVASARIIREPTFAAMLRHVVRTESTPPLWYALGWLVHRARTSIHGMRLLSVALGGALAALTVEYGARLLPLPAAAVAGSSSRSARSRRSTVTSSVRTSCSPCSPSASGSRWAPPSSAPRRRAPCGSRPSLRQGR